MPASRAVAASILTTIYHMLEDGTTYHDLGGNHFARRSTVTQLPLELLPAIERACRATLWV